MRGAERQNKFLIQQFCKQSSVPPAFSLLIAAHTSLINHSDEGMNEPQTIPLIARMLWDVAEHEELQDWRVMFFLKSYIELENEFKMPTEAITSLQSDYKNIPLSIERIVLVFSVRFEEVGHVMCVLIIRSASDGPFITVLDNIWNDATQKEYRLHYLNMLTQIGKCIGMNPVRVAMPINFAPAGVATVSKSDQPVWLQHVLEKKLVTGNVHSKALQCTYEAYLFIKLAVNNAPFVSYELERELSTMHTVIDNVNRYLIESIGSGCFQLSAVSIYIALLGSDHPGISPYYTIDADLNKSTNVYGLAVSCDKELVVKALKYGIGTDFHWETVSYATLGIRQRGPEDTLQSGKTVSHTTLGKRQREPEDTLQLDKLLPLFRATSPDMIPPGMRSLMTIDLILNKLSFKLQK